MINRLHIQITETSIFATYYERSRATIPPNQYQTLVSAKDR